MHLVEVYGGDTLTLDQIRSLSLQTAQDGFGDSDFSFSVSDDGTGSGGSVIWTLYGDQAIAQAETTTLQDLNADGIVGVNVTNTLFNPYNNGGNVSNLARYVYDTTGGYLISRNMLESSYGSGGDIAGGYTDLRNVERGYDSLSGPSVVLIDRDDIDLSDQDEIAGARLLQTTTTMGGSSASGYELIVKLWDEQHASIVGIESVIFELDGSIRERETFTSTAAINAKEVELRVDLNNNAVVGANIQDVLYDPADYGEMGGNDYVVFISPPTASSSAMKTSLLATTYVVPRLAMIQIPPPCCCVPMVVTRPTPSLLTTAPSERSLLIATSPRMTTTPSLAMTFSSPTVPVM